MAQSIERGTDEPRAPGWLEPALNGIPSAKVGELVRLAIEKSRLAETVVDNLRHVFEFFGAPIIIETLLDLFELVAVNDSASLAERTAAAVGFSAVYASGRDVPRVDLARIDVARIRAVEEIEQLDEPTRKLVRDVREGTIEELALLRRGYAIVRCEPAARGEQRPVEPASPLDWIAAAAAVSLNDDVGELSQLEIKKSEIHICAGVEDRTVRQWAKRGDWPASIRVEGREHVLRLVDVLRWLVVNQKERKNAFMKALPPDTLRKLGDALRARELRLRDQAFSRGEIDQLEYAASNPDEADGADEAEIREDRSGARNA